MTESERMIKRILVAVDGSQQSLNAVRLASEIAQSTHAEMTLLAVVEVADVPELMMTDQINGKGVAMDSLLEEAAELAVSHGLEAKTALRHGHPADQILRFAKEQKIDMIVTGSRGRGDAKGIIMGSVSRAITKRAEIPVLIVR
jgi:nucleotide-binding universal stress UspA family protein